jgi:hypothetical protein
MYSERFLDLDEFLDSIDHILNESLLGSSQSSSVGDVEDTIISLGMLTMDTSDLHEVLSGDLLELLLLLHELWKLDVDGGSEGGSEIRWARGDVTKMLIVGELADGLDVGGSSAESVENFEDTSSWLHGDDSELILLIDPDEESLGVVVEDTSAGWPVSVKVACLQESVSLPII